MTATLQQLFDDRWEASAKYGNQAISCISKEKDKCKSMLVNRIIAITHWEELPRQPKPLYDGIALHRYFYDKS